MANLWTDDAFGDMWQVRWVAPVVIDNVVTTPPYIKAGVNQGTEHIVATLPAGTVAEAQQAAGCDIIVGGDGVVVVAYTLAGATPVYRKYCRNGKAPAPTWADS